MHIIGFIAVVIALVAVAYQGMPTAKQHASNDESGNVQAQVDQQDRSDEAKPTWDADVRQTIDQASALIKRMSKMGAVIGGERPSQETVADPSRSWAWGIESNDESALYDSWKRWAASQGNGMEPVMAFMDFAKEATAHKRVALLAAAASDGNWPIIYNMLSLGLVKPEESTQQGRAVIEALSQCQGQTTQCDYLAAIQALAPRTAASIYEGIRQEGEALPEGLDMEGLKRMAISWAEHAYTGKGPAQ